MARGYVVVELYSHHIMYHPQSSGHGLSQEEEALKRPKDTGLVEEMVDQVELLCRIALRPIHVAVKGGVSDIKGGFPHIGEF